MISKNLKIIFKNQIYFKSPSQMSTCTQPRCNESLTPSHLYSTSHLCPSVKWQREMAQKKLLRHIPCRNRRRLIILFEMTFFTIFFSFLNSSNLGLIFSIFFYKYLTPSFYFLNFPRHLKIFAIYTFLNTSLYNFH